ncbi:metallophosphoesterase [Thermodesulfobacteriota bacterium]
MKICAVSDYHYNNKRENIILSDIYQINDINPDVFIYGGDLAQRANMDMRKCLKVLNKIKAKHKLFVCGNHDIYTGKDNINRDGSDILIERLLNLEGSNNSSLLQYQKHLGDLVRSCGFHYLDSGPKIINGVGFVGNMGWYDFSMKPETIKDGVFFKQNDLQKRFSWQEFTKTQLDKKYAIMVEVNLSKTEIAQRKIKLFSDKHNLHFIGNINLRNIVLETSGDFGKEYFSSLVTHTPLTYSDRTNVFLGMSDENFLRTRINKIRSSLDLVHKQCDLIIFASHMLPFKEGVIINEDDVGMCFRAVYNGSTAIGELLLEYEKVRYALHGHYINTEGEYSVGSVTCINIHHHEGKKPVVIDI